MGNSNTLMFKVGIADIKAELDKHKKEIESWVNSNPIKLKVQLEDSSLEQLAAKLKAMGATFGESNEEIKKMKEELNALRTILDAVMNGTSKKESAATNELRVMTKGAETAVQAMNQLSTVVNETMSRAGSGKMFPVLDRVPAIYSKLMFDIENRMTAIGNIMSKGNLPSWLDNGQGRGYMNNVFADYERLLKTMQRFKEEGFIDFHNVLALKDVFRGLESAYGPIIKQAGEYNKQVEKQASDVAKYEQQKAESIRKAEEKGEKERSAAREKEEKEYDKFWQKNLNEREKAAEKSAKAEENAINQNLKTEERAGAARVAAREKMEKEYEKVWQNGLKEREKAQANAEAKQAKEAELYTKNSIKNYNTWQESIRRAGVELTTIGIKIRQLEQTEARAKNAGVDTSSIKARIEALKQEEQILTRIHNGEKGLGTAKDYIRSESYQRELKLAQEVNAVTNKSAIEKERADNKDIKNLEIKEANQRRYNSLLNDMESILNRVSRVESKGGLLGLDTANISGRIKELQSFIDKTLNMDMRNLGDNGYISNLRAEWNALKKSINDATKEQERLNTAQEKSNTAAIKAQASEYKSLKKSTQEARKEAEKLVADRQKMLQDQASSLSKIMIQGRGKLDTYQYEQIRDALKAIREELRQIDAMKQRGGLSVSALLGMGSGTNNAASLISSYKQFISGKKDAADANSKLSLSEQQLVNAIKVSNGYLTGQGQVLSDLKMMATQYLSVWGAQSFINNIIELGGQLEQQRLSIGAILQDTAQANHLFSQIKALAIKSPFGVQQLDAMSKQLSAYSFKYSELYDWTKRLADISAATGTSVDRLALALGHVRSEGALSGYTLRQFSMGNIPLLEKLSENLGKTKQEIRKMTRNKEIGYEDVLNVLKQLTEEGGMFYNAQEIMAEALNAKFKNLRDSFQIMYSEMAEGAPGDFLKSVAEALTNMSRNWKVLIPMISVAAGAIGMQKAVTMALNYELAREGVLTSKSAAEKVKYTAATNSAIAATGKWTLALRGAGRALASLVKYILSPWTLGFAAVEGLVYLWQKHNQEVQKAKELSEQYSLTASESQKNIGKQLESNGAYSNQMSDSQLKTGIESMIESLKNYRADAQEIINTIYGADAEGRVMSLADKYKYLRKELEKTNDIYKEMARTSDAFEYGINYGDGGWFDENVETDLTDYANKLKEYNNAFTNMVADHGVAVHNALEIAKNASPEFRKVAQELSNDADRIRWIYENRTENRDLYNTFNSALGSESGEMLAWNLGSGMKKAEKEANEELDKFMTGVEAKLKKFGYDFSGNGKNLSFVQVGNLLQQSKEWLEKHPEWQNIYDVIWDKLNKRWGIPIVPETEEVEEKLPKWMEDMQKELDKTGIKLKADMSMEQIVDEMKKAYDKAQTTINKLGPIALTAKVNIEGMTDADIEKFNDPTSFQYNPELYSTLKQLKSARDAKSQVDTAANKRGIKLEGMKKDGSHKKEKQNQENAKAVREQVRIIKEAADAYQYWRDKVGDKGAWAHVRQEFGKVLDDLNITADNIENVRKHLNNIPNTKAYKAIKDKKIRTEIKKEISKENDQYNRKDFEKSTEEFLSRTQIELDNLTRSWEMFNSVRDATGDVELAVQLSGAEYANGKNRNLADAIKEQIQQAFNDAGGQGQLDFNKLISDKEIESMFKNAENAGGEYEKRIKSLVEAYKKWRDLQRDVQKNDTSVFLKAFENEYDRKQQFDKIVSQYEESKQSLDSLLSQWLSGAVDTNGNRLGITQEQYNRAFGYLTAQANWEKFKAKNDFKWVFDNIGTTSLETIKKMVKAMREYAKTTEMSEKETKAWHEAMDKLLDQESVLNPLNSIADAVKSYNDAVVNRKNAEEALRISKMSYVERKRNGIDESTVKPLQQAQDDYRQALSDEEKALLRVTKSIKSFSDSIGELGSTLSSLGSSIGGDFGDIMNGVGGMLSDISNGMNSATKLAEAIKTKGLSGTISKVSATIGIINSIVDFNKKLDSLLPSSESLYQKYADRQRKINKLQEQIADYQVEALKRQIESTNWLYTNGLSELRNQGYEKENLLKEYANSMLRPQEIYKEARSGFSKWGPAIIGAIVAVVGTVLTLGIGSVGSAALGATIAAALGTTATAAVGAALAAGAGAAIGTALRSAADSFVYSSDQTSARQNMRVQTRHKTFFRSEKTQNLEDWVRENYGKELFDSNHYDLIDIELAKQLLEDGPTLVGETRETLERLVEYAEKIREIEDNVKEYVSQMFSPLVDDATDALWDWLDNGKDMLDSFEEYASDTFKDIAKDAVKSFLKINLIDKYQDKLNDIFTAYSLGAYNEQELGLAVASVAGDIRDSYEALIPALQALGESFDRAFEAQGYDIINGGSGNSGSTSNTIKGINEQTWDLGISYWNAIRADVSINRAMIAQYFPLFYTSITSGNTKLQNIENNTAAIMRSNDEIRRIVDDVYSLFNGLKTKAWRMPIA